MDSTKVDPGLGGFFSALGGENAPAPAPDPSDTRSQDEPTAADSAAPESPDGEMTAEELVAARLAASLDADGIAIPDPDATAETPADAEDHPLLASPEGDVSLDSLTPEQLKALAEEAIRLRGEVSTSVQAERQRKVAAAEAAAIAQVQAAFEHNVVAVGAAHYKNEYRKRLADLAAKVTEAELPDAAAALADQVYAARAQWEAEQAEAYEQQAKQAALNARLQSPDFRQYAAETLVAQAGLPASAVAKVLETADTRQFETRVKELVETRDALLAIRTQNQSQVRAEANKRLAETTPRTAPTGRLPGGKPPAYKGVIAEGIAIIRS